jgi:hypothetical protein
MSGAVQYEISIYSTTPLPVWVILISGIIAGSIISIYATFTKPNKVAFWAGIVIIVLVKAFMSFLPIIKGYLLYGSADTMAQLEATTDILAAGNIGTNIYPLPHILMSSIILASSNTLPVVGTMQGLLFLACLLNLIFIYLVAKKLFDNRQTVNIVVLASVPFLLGMFNVAFYAQGYALLILPMIIYFYLSSFGRNVWQTRVIFLLLLLSIVFTHPVVAVAWASGLLMCELFKAVSRDPTSRSKGFLSGIKINLRNINIVPVLILGIALFQWFSKSSYFDTKINILAKTILGEAVAPPHIRAAISSIDMNLMNFVDYIVKQWSILYIYIALSVVAIAIIHVKRKEMGRKSVILSLISIFVIFGFLSDVVFFFGIQAEYPTRFIRLNTIVAMSPLFVGYIIYYLTSGLNNLRKSVLLLLIMIPVATLSVITLYNSPIVYGINYQKTYSDVYGFKWFLDNRDPTLWFGSLGVDHASICFMPGYNDYLKDPRLVAALYSLIYLERSLVPSHLGYDVHYGGAYFYGAYVTFYIHPPYITIGQQFSDNTYIMVTPRFIEGWNDPTLSNNRVTAPETSRWDITPADMNAFKNDRSVDAIYSNGAFLTYLIRGIAS